MYEVNDNLEGILLRDVRWDVKTAGPSPYGNSRTEVFLLGCKKAMSGNICKGCFNPDTWDAAQAEFSHDPVKMAKHIEEHAPNKYVTIGGGEPTDQIENLVILCRELKTKNFHIMVYTYRQLEKYLKKGLVFNSALDEEALLRGNLRELTKYVDIIVDGEYEEEFRLWDGNKEDGLFSSVGSSNQIVWDMHKGIGFKMGDLLGVSLNENNDLIYSYKNSNPKIYSL